MGLKKEESTQGRLPISVLTGQMAWKKAGHVLGEKACAPF